jgi:gas vesicle protein
VARRDERDIVVIEQGGGGSVWWLMAGGLLGAGLALLFAPRTGEETRRILARRLAKLKDSAEDAFLAGENEDEDEDTADAEAAGPGAATPPAREDRTGSHSALSPARLELEKRLADARARRQRALVEEDEEPVA